MLQSAAQCVYNIRVPDLSMQSALFRIWLKDEYVQRSGVPLAAGTQVSRIANCSTVEQIEGDLDAHYEKDALAGLLAKLTYSEDDLKQGRPPLHGIPIDGNFVNGTGTYRSAINLYRKFRHAQEAERTIERRMLEPAPSLDESVGTLLTKTEREALAKSRIGQGRFRSHVMELWDYQCAVSGATILLTASHMKPWRSSTNSERLDGWNGLALSPAYDAAFDAGLITFDKAGRLIMSRRLGNLDAAILGFATAARIEGLQPRHVPYLDYHRRHCLRD